MEVADGGAEYRDDMRIALFALARPTFDVAYADEVRAEASQALRTLGCELAGAEELLMDTDAVYRSAHGISGAVDAVVVLFSTFTDSTLPAAVAAAIDEPIVLWSVPEERTGGRLRLNSLCGMNLAGYTLTQNGRSYRWMYCPPSDDRLDQRFHNAVSGIEPFVPRSVIEDPDLLPHAEVLRADELRRRIGSVTIGVVGDHPAGFEPCGYDPERLQRTTGLATERVELPALFEAGRSAAADEVLRTREREERRLGNLDELDQTSLDASLRLHCGLKDLAKRNQWAGVAVRCWPECLNEFGGAACSPNSLLTDDGIPGCCEADVYGVATSLVLQAVAGEPAFVADLVHLDIESNTAVFWHCGNAPTHMASPAEPAHPTVHSSSGLPLLNEFALKPGRVTIARLSQAGGTDQLVIGGGEALAAPRPFSGTAGVVRLDHPAERVLETVMGRGLEHHYGIAYGDHHKTLAALASRWQIPVLAL